MTRLWILSDLHQDVPANAWDPSARAPASFDAVIVAGDAHSPLTSALEWLHERMAGVRVVYVPGNHDHWCGPDAQDRFTLDEQLLRGRDLAARRGIDLLSDDQVVVDGTRVVGSTLWTDFALSARVMTVDPFRTAAKAMNDFRRIRRRATGRHKYVRPTDLLQLHRASRSFLDRTLTTPHEGPTVVVTHHAPHPGSLVEPNDALSGCYASDLSALIEGRSPELWVHGHMHGRADHVVGATRVLCNARGHVGEASVATFDPALVVDVGAAIPATRSPAHVRAPDPVSGTATRTA